MIMIFFTCNNENLDCFILDDFMQVWWQIRISDVYIGNCYMFAEDGYFIETNGEETWVNGQWNVEYIDECSYSIISGDEKIDIEGIDEGCIELVYEEKKYTACECSL